MKNHEKTLKNTKKAQKTRKILKKPENEEA